MWKDHGVLLLYHEQTSAAPVSHGPEQAQLHSQLPHATGPTGGAGRGGWRGRDGTCPVGQQGVPLLLPCPDQCLLSPDAPGWLHLWMDRLGFLLWSLQGRPAAFPPSGLSHAPLPGCFRCAPRKPFVLTQVFVIWKLSLEVQCGFPRWHGLINPSAWVRGEKFLSWHFCLSASLLVTIVSHPFLLSVSAVQVLHLPKDWISASVKSLELHVFLAILVFTKTPQACF